MYELNFPKYTFNIKKQEGKTLILCLIRKKFIVLTPEEWVRQNTLAYLIEQIHCPASLVSVERKITINKITKRYDIVVFYPSSKVFLSVECKAPNVVIDQSTFDQIARYNSVLNASFLMVTNGINHFFCQIDYQNQRYNFMESLPLYK